MLLDCVRAFLHGAFSAECLQVDSKDNFYTLFGYLTHRHLSSACNLDYILDMLQNFSVKLINNNLTYSKTPVDTVFSEFVENCY